MAVSSLLVTCDETTEKFKKILQANEVNDEVSEVIVKDAGLKTAGFASQTHYVTVKFVNTDIKPLNLFVKTETVSADHTKFLEETKLFEKEAVFFTEYVPALREFCGSKGQNSLLDIYPKCYFGSKRMMVFENVVLDKGFELLDREGRQDFDAACLSLITLAKHHAISLAYTKEIGGRNEFAERFPALVYDAFATPTLRGMMETSLEDAVTTSIEIIQKSNVKGKEEAISMLRENSGKMWEFVSQFSKIDPEDDDGLIVLNHGDYHSNNGLFLRDKESQKLIGHVAVDLQAVRLGSPSLDMSNFIYSSVQHEVRRNKLKELLTVYLNAFNSTCEKLDSPVNLSYEELFRLYCKNIGFGVWFLGLMTSNSACYVILKEIDITKIDIHNWGKIMSELVQKWVAENPETCESDAEKIVAMLMEYKKFGLNN